MSECAFCDCGSGTVAHKRVQYEVTRTRRKVDTTHYDAFREFSTIFNLTSFVCAIYLPNIQWVMGYFVKVIIIAFYQKKDVVVACHKFSPSEYSELVFPDNVVD